jgi:SAM-dependent methyltransferase
MPVDLYDNVYGDFDGRVEAAVRERAFGDDIGQSSWITAAEWLGFADRTLIGAASRVLEVGSGSGGPAVYLAEARACHVTGVDINEHGVANAARLAAAKGVADRVMFQVTDAGRPLPFPESSFDAVLSNDAMCHIPDRQAVLAEWFRVLRPGGRMLFTDAMIVTGIVSHDELAVRSSIGTYFFLPPGKNEQLVRQAGFDLLASEDVTSSAEAIAARWHAARQHHRDALVKREGEKNFAGLQRFLACVHRLSAERRLSRFAYLGERPR